MSFATVFDIDGVEYYVMHTKYNEKFNIELDYGKVEEKKRGHPALILTQELKTVILENKALRADDFGEFLTPSTIYGLRRRLKKNPYKSYTEWVESTDPDKPKEVTFLNERDNPTIITDCFGAQYLVYSARIASNGIVVAMGKPLKEYTYKSKQGNSIIITQELAEYIKKHRYHPFSVCRELSIIHRLLQYIRKSLGYEKNAIEDANKWLAAHLVEITSMTKDDFVSQYLRNMNIGKGNMIKHFNHGLYLLQTWSKSTEKEHRTLFRIVRTLDTKSTADVNKDLNAYMPYPVAAKCTKAYKILMLAEEYNHPIPKEYKGIILSEKELSALKKEQKGGNS